MSAPPLPSDWRSRIVGAARALAVGGCEERSNRGVVPDYCARTAQGDVGLFWCMYFVVAVFARTLARSCPLLLSGSCEQQRQRALKRGALRTRQQFDEALAQQQLAVAGWVFLCIGPDEQGRPHAHHTGIVGVVRDDGAIIVAGPHGGFLVSEGNAADPAKPASRNGDGAYSGRERGHRDDLTVYEFIDPEALAAA